MDITPGSEAEKYPASENPRRDSPRAVARLSVVNTLDFLKTDGSEAEK